MLILYDVMLIDNDPVLTKPQRDRRKHLEQLVSPIPGRADLVMREEIYFSSPDGPKRLQRGFASGITQRWEGFVLKPCDEPYFTMMEHSRDNYAGRWIKLKKDYIQGLGDTADFAVVGAGYDSNAAKAAGIKNLPWTLFHIACLENKEDVLRFDAKPVFKVVDVVNQSVEKEDLETINQQGQFKSKPCDPGGIYEEFNVCMLSALDQKMEVVFREPFVFEVMGSGFDKLPNTDYFTLRFPRVLKIHWDRSFRDTVSFSEYEKMADQARNVPVDVASQEDAAWIARLEQADRGKSGTLACWEDSQTALLSSNDSAPSRTHSISPRRTKVTAPRPLIRVDTQEMLPGESRLQSDGAASWQSTQHSQSTVSLPTPPTSSPEVVLGMYFKTSSICEASHSSRSSTKRSADAMSGNQQGIVSKRRKSTATDCYKTVPKLVVSTTCASSKVPLSEITNPSYRRRASPPVKAMKKVIDLPDDTHSQDPMEQWGKPIANVALTPNPTPTEQSQPADDNPAPSSSTQTSATTQATTPSARSGTPETSRTPTRHECSLTNTLILLSPCISKMPYLTENLLPTHNTTVFTDPLRFAAHSNPPPTDPSASTVQRKRKIVLVESNRPIATAWLIREIARIDLYQDIGFFDWRVLEDVQGSERRGVDESSEEWQGAWRGRFSGRVRWVVEEGVEEGVGRGMVEWVYDGE